MNGVARQGKSTEWSDQWVRFEDNERFLFDEWIAPATIEDFRGKDVLECGCGGGQHTSFVAGVARSVTAVDLNTVEIARRRTATFGNVELREDDLATMDLGRQFDVVFSIGVIHHTDDPDKTFENIARHCRPGGKVIIWCYAAEGNFLMRWIVEPARKLIVRHLSRDTVAALSTTITALLLLPVYTIYRLPFLRFLPYYDYFANFRRLSFARNVLNVFDKLNAPQTQFITRARCERWFSRDRFDSQSVTIRYYAGVSWSLNGMVRS